MEIRRGEEATSTFESAASDSLVLGRGGWSKRLAVLMLLRCGGLGLTDVPFVDAAAKQVSAATERVARRECRLFLSGAAAEDGGFG